MFDFDALPRPWYQAVVKHSTQPLSDRVAELAQSRPPPVGLRDRTDPRVELIQAGVAGQFAALVDGVLLAD